MDAVPGTRPSLLVRLRNAQDERAWAEFVAIYSPLIHKLARRKGFQDADADDLVQEVLQAVAFAIDRWDPDPARGSFRNWLFRIARNMMINFLANQNRQPRGAGGIDLPAPLESQSAMSMEDSMQFDLAYKQQCFRWAAGQIRHEFQENTWRAFWETWVVGKKPKDVAAELGKNVGAVYMARSRVVARLRQVIEGVESTAHDCEVTGIQDRVCGNREN
jgi:RNA polymerase sigma factor (sigma-70 family)